MSRTVLTSLRKWLAASTAVSIVGSLVASGNAQPRLRLWKTEAVIAPQAHKGGSPKVLDARAVKATLTDGSRLSFVLKPDSKPRLISVALLDAAKSQPALIDTLHADLPANQTRVEVRLTHKVETFAKTSAHKQILAKVSAAKIVLASFKFTPLGKDIPASCVISTDNGTIDPTKDTAVGVLMSGTSANDRDITYVTKNGSTGNVISAAKPANSKVLAGHLYTESKIPMNTVINIPSVIVEASYFDSSSGVTYTKPSPTTTVTSP